MSPELLATRYTLKSLREGAQVAALILRHCPEFVTKHRPTETVDQYLRRIGHGTMDDNAVVEITEAARVNGSRRIADLKVWMRHGLADQLDAFARGMDR